MNPTKTILLAALTATVATGCYSRRVIVHENAGARPVVTREVVVTQAPPPAQVETAGVAPRSDASWIPGYWKRTGSRWDWVRGHWETQPQGFHTYIPGHWEQHSGGWVYYQGYWR